MMGWGKKAQALTSAVAAARVAVAPRPDPRVAAELTRTLSARATASCWVALVIIPFTIVAYDGAYYPAQLTRGAIAAAAADALILLLLIALRRHAFDQHPWLPFALLAGVICNVTEAVNLLLTGGTESDFVFPYYLISFGIAILFPAPLMAVIVTAFLLPVGYLAVAIAGHEPLGAKHFASNLMLLVDSALITCIGNRVVTNLFLREIKLRIDLEKANERLRELDRLKSEFFANVSHELRTPLTLILAPASSLSRESHGKLAPGQRAFVETIHRNATRLLQLINDLLLLAKLELGEPRIDRVPVDVGASVTRVAQEAQAYAQSLELQVDVDIEAGGPRIWNGDQRHLDRSGLNPTTIAAPSSSPEVQKVRLEPVVAPPVQATGTAGPRIAVVEDNADLLAYLTQELGRWYRVQPYPDSDQAVKAIIADPPDLIVSDIMMPGLDGIGLARQVRAAPSTASVPVLLLSAREEVEAKLAGFEAGE